MHALILADLEGVIGVYDLRNEQICRELFTKEIEVCVLALKHENISDITVCEIHNEGNMIDKDVLRSYGVKHISQMWNLTFDVKYDFAILTGFHGMSRWKSQFSHTFRTDIAEITSDGKPIGEVEVFCRYLGGHGIPVVLVTGDNEAVYEANSFNSMRHVCCVKGGTDAVLENHNELYKKLMLNISISVKTDLKYCLSMDSLTIKVSFNDENILDQLYEAHEQLTGNSLIFNNCDHFIPKLKSLCVLLNEIKRKTIASNYEFAKEMRNIVGDLPKESIRDEHVKSLLSKNVVNLTRKDRELLRMYFLSLTKSIRKV